MEQLFITNQKVGEILLQFVDLDALKIGPKKSCIIKMLI